MMWGRWRELKAEREAKQLAFLKQHAELKEAEAKRKAIDEVLDRHARQVKRSDYEGGKWLTRVGAFVRFVGSDPPPQRPHTPADKDEHGPMVCYLYGHSPCNCFTATKQGACWHDTYSLREVVARSLPLRELDSIEFDPNLMPFADCPQCLREFTTEEHEPINPPEEPIFGWQCRYCGYRFVMLVMTAGAE